MVARSSFGYFGSPPPVVKLIVEIGAPRIVSIAEILEQLRVKGQQQIVANENIPNDIGFTLTNSSCKFHSFEVQWLKSERPNRNHLDSIQISQWYVVGGGMSGAVSG